ncbi:MAG: hypothetical protein ACPGN3_03330 [Opitutales bacterium]
MKDSEIWKIFEGIANLHENDVFAHSAANEMPDEDARASLKRFAIGDIEEEERSALCAQLKDNPAWVTYLADCIKEQRVA